MIYHRFSLSIITKKRRHINQISEPIHASVSNNFNPMHQTLLLSLITTAPISDLLPSVMGAAICHARCKTAGLSFQVLIIRGGWLKTLRISEISLSILSHKAHRPEVSPAI